MINQNLNINCIVQLLIPEISAKRRNQKGQPAPIFVAEPMRASNSFVGTEEYIAPVSILFLGMYTNQFVSIIYAEIVLHGFK